MSPARLVAASSLAACLMFAVTVSCGSRQTCSSTSCNGCCDSSAVCQPGDAAAVCGAHGATCTACGSADVCTLGQCVAGTATGGGTTANGGGTAATGGGSAATGGGSSSSGGGTAHSGGGSGATGGGSNASGGGSAASGGGSSSTGGGGTGLPCASNSCLGCCDIFGNCQNSTTDHCGLAAADCQACTSGGSCQAGICSGGAGGGTGTGGGSSSSCPSISLNGGTTTGEDDPSSVSVALTRLGTAELLEELWWMNPPTFPYTESFTDATRWQSCTGCVTYRTACTGMATAYPFATCTGRAYLGQSGSITFTSGSDPSPGGVAGSTHDVLLLEWDFDGDEPVVDGGCLALPDSAFNVTF